MKDTPNTASFIGYEYKSLTVNRRMESVYADGYQNFGWKLEDVSAPPDGGRRPFEKKYDELYDVCEKANGLLGGE